MRKDIDYPELMTGAEARRYLGMIAPVWLELLETEQLPKPVRVHNRLKWRKTDLMAWVKGCEQVELAE